MLSKLTRDYWQKVILDWGEARAESLPGPQHDECLMAIEEIRAEMNKPAPIAPEQCVECKEFAVVFRKNGDPLCLKCGADYSADSADEPGEPYDRIEPEPWDPIRYE